MKKLINTIFLFCLFYYANSQVLTIEASANKTDILTCETLTYTLKYSCGGTTANCTNVTMTASFQDGGSFPYQAIGLTSDILSYSFSSDYKTVTFVFKEPLIAGHTGIIEVVGRGQCGRADGTIATLDATIYSGAVAEDMQTVTTTLHSTNKFCPQKGHGVGMAIDNPTTYEINLSMPGNYGHNGYGATSVNDVVMIDNFPPNTVINSFSVTGDNGLSGLTYPSNVCIIDNTPSAPKLTCTFPNSSFNVVSSYGPKANVLVNVTYSDTYFNAGDNVTNSVTVNYTPEGGTPQTATNGTTITYQNGDLYGSTITETCTSTLNVTDQLSNPAPVLLVRKTESATTIRPGEEITYGINVSNTGNVKLNDVVVEDIIPAELEVIRIQNFTGFYGLEGTETTSTMIKTVSNPVYTLVTLPYYSIAGDYVTSIKTTISSIPANGQFLYFGIFVKLKPNVTSGTITNCITGSTSTPGTTINNSAACTTMSIVPLDNYSTIGVNKYLANCPNSQYCTFYGASQTVGTLVYSNVYAFNQSGGQDLQNPVLMDLLPIGLTFSNNPGDIIYGTSSCGFPQADNVEIIPNYNGSGRTLIRLSWNTPLPSGCYLWVSFKTTVNNLAIAGNVNSTLNLGDAYQTPVGVLNPAFFTGSSPNKIFRFSIYTPYEELRTVDIYDLDGDGQTLGDTIAFALGYVGASSSAQLESVKWVKGQLDTDYHKYPNSGYTMPGGLANYKLIVTNNGNTPATQFQIVDILPFVGDGGVIDLSSRLTQWRPNLVTPISTPAGVTVYYSTSGNPCRTDFAPSGPSGCTPAGWTTVLPEDPTTIQSIKLDFGSLVLNPGDQLEMYWDMRAPVTAPTNGEIAWNSFGYKAIRADNNNPFLPAEPFKVGIAIQPVQPGSIGNYIWCDTNDNGIQDSGEQGQDGVRVELFRDNGDGISNPYSDEFVTFTASGNGGLYSFPDLVPGDYYVVIYVPVGSKISSKDATNDNSDSDGTASTFNGHKVAITPVTNIGSAEFDDSWDQGFVCNYYASVGNYVWYDENQDNIQNESASNGINGIVVSLYTSGGTLVATTTTTNDKYGRPGYYLFQDLQPGSYYVKFNLNTDMTFTTGTGSIGGSSSDELDSDPGTNGQTATFTLSAGETDLTWDAGIILQTGPYKLGNFVWNDSNNNGVWDAGEMGINNVVVNLYKDINNDNIPQPTEFLTSVLTSTISGINGIYKFDNLPSGNYLVQIPASNFGSVLNGLVTSTGNDPAPDPDDNVENDDNGFFDATYGVISQSIYLGDQAEPLETGYANYSVDFGFTQPLCELSSAGLSNVICNNNGTTSIGTDDYITFSLNPTGTGLGTGYTVTASGGATVTPTSGTYGSATNFQMQNGSANGTTYTITITDNATGACQVTTTVNKTSCSTCPTPDCLNVQMKKN